MMKPGPEQFEMRRLESLSSTIFGVAMTLLAYGLPKIGLENPPSWGELYRLYAAPLSGLVLSFVIAGVFWFSHQRRLARQPYGGQAVVFLNLLFLLSIILLPVTNGLYGGHRFSNVIAVIYGLHLTVIAALNAWLWWLVDSSDQRRPDLIAAALPVLVFLPGALVAAFAPRYAQYLWFLAFGALFVRLFVRAPPA